MSLIMKILVFIFFVLLLKPCHAQVVINDSAFVKINELNPSLLKFYLGEGKIRMVIVKIKTKYEESTGFVSGMFHSDLELKEKSKIEQKKIISYQQYNTLLNNDFLNIWMHYKTYFIISEDKTNYLLLRVSPITPPGYIKM